MYTFTLILMYWVRVLMAMSWGTRLLFVQISRLLNSFICTSVTNSELASSTSLNPVNMELGMLFVNVIDEAAHLYSYFLIIPCHKPISRFFRRCCLCHSSWLWANFCQFSSIRSYLSQFSILFSTGVKDHWKPFAWCWRTRSNTRIISFCSEATMNVQA